jgi:hypothetical protein
MTMLIVTGASKLSSGQVEHGEFPAWLLLGVACFEVILGLAMATKWSSRAAVVGVMFFAALIVIGAVSKVEVCSCFGSYLEVRSKFARMAIAGLGGFACAMMLQSRRSSRIVEG